MASEKTRQRNARGHGGRLREEVIAAMLRIIDTGQPNPSLRAVAKEAGIAGPSLYAHFADLAEIRHAAIRTCLNDLISELEPAQTRSDPTERLYAVCRAYVGYALRNPDRYALMFQRNRDARELTAVRETGALALQILVDAIAACREQGSSTAADPYDSALAVWSAIHGFATLRSTRPHFDRLQTVDLLPFIVRQLAELA